MYRSIILHIVTLLTSTLIFAQDAVEVYRSPLNIPLALSANYGEIRTTHFHTGVDFKTQGVTGKAIYAIADGYVSRLSVSPSGYGNAIYLTHPSLRTMSVYGHLERYAPQIAKYVKAQQYKKSSFSQNLMLSSDQFPVKKGDLIGYTGNTGSSGGPHLHFEIRDLATQAALSPLIECGYGKYITDTTPPRIVSVKVVGVDETYGIPIHIKDKSYNTSTIAKGQYKIIGDTILLKRDSYLAFEVTEVKDNSTNIFGVTSMSLKDEEREVWGYNIKSISFAYGRTINTFTLHPETTQNRNDFLRTYITPENRLGIYTSKVDNGMIYKHKLLSPKRYTVTATDEAGNSSELSFVIKADTTPTESIDTPKGDLIFAGKYHTIKDSTYKIVFEPQTLQEPLYLEVNSVDDARYKMSKVVKMGNIYPPFNKAATIYIKPNNLEGINLSKLVVCRLSSNGSLSSVGGRYKDGYVSATISYSGNFVLAQDVTKPTITPLFSSKSQNLKSLKFKINDNLSGVYSFNGQIDSKWVLFEYDAKTGTISHSLDSEITTKGETHYCNIVVSDLKGNSASYKTSFTW